MKILRKKLSNLLIFKLITLNHNEWFEIKKLNINNNEIIRLKDNYQYGKFELIKKI